jgi:hypothetical protein
LSFGQISKLKITSIYIFFHFQNIRYQIKLVISGPRRQGDQMSLGKKFPANFSSKLKHNIYCGKKTSPKVWAISEIKNAQIKQSPNMRKFAQSGHPVWWMQSDDLYSLTGVRTYELSRHF